MKHNSFLIAKLLLCVWIALLTNASHAQDNNTSAIAIGVVMPENIKGVPTELLPLLEAKIEAVITSQGLSAQGDAMQSFAAYPVLSIFGSQTTAGGMQNITVVTGNLSLVIKQVATNTVFSSISKNVQGSGLSQEEATRDIFNEINPSDPDFVSFVEKAKGKILNYYVQNCDNIIKKAQTERMQKKFESALSILLAVPVEASSCYDKIQAQANTIFEDMQKYNCSKYVQQAKSYAAANDYEHALQRLSMIDPTVSCSSDAKELLANISKEVDNEVKNRWDLLFKIYDGKIEVAKAKAYTRENIKSYVLKAGFINPPDDGLKYPTIMQ